MNIDIGSMADVGAARVRASAIRQERHFLRAYKNPAPKPELHTRLSGARVATQSEDKYAQAELTHTNQGNGRRSKRDSYLFCLPFLSFFSCLFISFAIFLAVFS